VMLLKAKRLYIKIKKTNRLAISCVVSPFKSVYGSIITKTLVSGKNKPVR